MNLWRERLYRSSKLSDLVLLGLALCQVPSRTIERHLDREKLSSTLCRDILRLVDKDKVLEDPPPNERPTTHTTLPTGDQYDPDHRQSHCFT